MNAKPFPLNPDLIPNSLALNDLQGEYQCTWCKNPTPATCMVPSWSDYTLKELKTGSCLVPACDKHGQAIMLRVGLPREQRKEWLEGTQWPLCHLCGKTLYNPQFGGKPLPYDLPNSGNNLTTMAHEKCIQQSKLK